MSLVPLASLYLGCSRSAPRYLTALPAMLLIPLTLSLPLSRPLGFAHLCRGFPARSVRSIAGCGEWERPYFLDVHLRCQLVWEDASRDRAERPTRAVW
jgi:hypothetical protein